MLIYSISDIPTEDDAIAGMKSSALLSVYGGA